MRRLIAAGALLTFAAGCGSGGTATPTPTPTPTVTIDAAATEMCHKLAEGRTLEANAQYAKVNEVRALTVRIEAQTLALKSTVPEVHRIAMDTDQTSGMISVPRLEGWCTANGFRL